MSAKQRWAIANGAWDGVTVTLVDGRSFFASRAVLDDPETVRLEDPTGEVLVRVRLDDVAEVAR